jgi:hypothetical protein
VRQASPSHAQQLLAHDNPGAMFDEAEAGRRQASADAKRASFARSGSRGSSEHMATPENAGNPRFSAPRRGGSGLLAEGGWKASIAGRVPSRSNLHAAGSRAELLNYPAPARKYGSSNALTATYGGGASDDDAAVASGGRAPGKTAADASDSEGGGSDNEIDSDTASYFMFLDRTEGARRRACDRGFAVAMLSIVAQVAAIEVRFVSGERTTLVDALKLATSVLTLVTLYFIARFHSLEFQLLQHRHILPKEMRIYQSPSFPTLLLELFVVALHPVPFFEGTYQILRAEVSDGEVRPVTSQQGTITPSHPISTDVLGIIVFLRIYLVLRVLKFRGALYGPAARFIGALNNVDFDLRFMLKALVNLHPFRILGTSLLYILLSVAYSIWAIERERDDHFFLDDSLWFLIVTMTTGCVPGVPFFFFFFFFEIFFSPCLLFSLFYFLIPTAQSATATLSRRTTCRGS